MRAPRLVRAKLPFIPSWRDRLAWRLAGVALLIATPTYRALLRGTCIEGLRSAIRETDR